MHCRKGTPEESGEVMECVSQIEPKWIPPGF